MHGPLGGRRGGKRQRDGHAVPPRKERRGRPARLRQLRGSVRVMPAKRVIPCLDVTDGRVVKGVRFQDLRDAGDPAELAAAYDREGADEIVFLDITASSDAREILLTSMDFDGTHEGYDIELLRAVRGAVRLPVIASGGAGSARHMYEALTNGGADAALAASIFHFGELTIPDVKQELVALGLEV